MIKVTEILEKGNQNLTSLFRTSENRFKYIHTDLNTYIQI